MINKHSLDKKDFKQLLLVYRDALIREVMDISICENHPLRAAKALAALNKDQQPGYVLNNLNRFSKEATDSKMYPSTKIALNILYTFAIIVCLSLIIPTLLITSGFIPLQTPILALGYIAAFKLCSIV